MADSLVANDGFLEFAYLLDDKYVTKKILDTFESATWAERYYDAGDFSMTLPVTEDIVRDVKINDYVCIRESEEYMILETMTLKTDAKDGDRLVIEGRSLVSILNRRIVWEAFKKPGQFSFQLGLKELIEQNAISPKDTKRAIPGLKFVVSEDPDIVALTATFDIEVGENLFDVVASMCSEKKLGFRMKPDGEGGFAFELYFGKDHSWSQDKNPVVVFSDSYENLSDTEYVQSEKDYISNAKIRGDTYEAEVFRKMERTGLARREAYLQISGEKTAEELIQKTKEQMSKMSVTEMFGGNVEPFHQFVLNRDYFLGDIVQVQNRYGFEGRSRITEVLRTRDASGPVLTPTFAVVDKNEEVESDKDEETEEGGT